MLSCIWTTSTSERLMRLVGWFIWKYDDARTYKPQIFWIFQLFLKSNRNDMLSCIWKTSRSERLMHLVGWFIWIKKKVLQTATVSSFVIIRSAFRELLLARQMRLSSEERCCDFLLQTRQKHRDACHSLAPAVCHFVFRHRFISSKYYHHSDW
jgi:hypothetical protein